jgi:hypothetical protein
MTGSVGAFQPASQSRVNVSSPDNLPRILQERFVALEKMGSQRTAQHGAEIRRFSSEASCRSKTPTAELQLRHGLEALREATLVSDPGAVIVDVITPGIT